MATRNPYSSGRSNINGPIILVGIVVIGIILAIVVPIAHQYFKTSYATATVCDKERVAKSDSSEYRVYTAKSVGNSTTYVVKDSLIGGYRTNSADSYAKLQRGTTYNLKLKGFRNGPLSEFPNILKADRSTVQHPEYCQS